MDAPLKVLIADDHPLILHGIRRALEGTDDMDVVGEARSGDELVALVGRRSPDVVLLDLNMPGKSGIECVAELTRDHPSIKTVVISAYDDRGSIDAALQAGASAYIVKSVSPVDIPAALRQAASGAIFHAPSSAPRHADEAGSDPAVHEL